MREFIVGDVHGCLEELKALLKKADIQPEDRVILVGDLINKGPYPYETLEFVREKGFEFVMGNHEDHLVRYYHKEYDSAFLSIDLLLERLGDRAADTVEWLQNQPYYIRTPHALVVHGGVVPGQRVEDTPPRTLCRIRHWGGSASTIKNTQFPAWFDLYTEEELVVFGHWASQGLVWRANAIGLDSGCVYGRQLTGVFLPEKRLVQVSALKAYEPIIIK